MTSTCSVANCQNDRRYKDRWIILPHVYELQFHRPKLDNYRKWEHKLERTGYKVTKNTRVCSNHFKYGKPLFTSNTPTLYMRSYPTWALTISDLHRELSNIPEDIVCDVLAHMMQYAKDIECAKEKLSSHLSDDMIQGIRTYQQLSMACLNLDEHVASDLISQITPLIPYGKCLEAVAVFKHGIEFDGTKRVRKLPNSVPGSNVCDIETSPDIITVSNSFHDYCAFDDNAQSPEHQDHSYIMQSEHSDSVHVISNTKPTLPKIDSCKRRVCQKKTRNLELRVKTLEMQVAHLRRKLQMRTKQRNEKQQHIKLLQSKEISPKVSKPNHVKVLSTDIIKGNDELVCLHTGLPTYELFNWVFSEIKGVAEKMTYWGGHSGNASDTDHVRKAGPVKFLSLEDQFLMALMKLKLNMSGDYLAFLFGVSSSNVSITISTWIPMLSNELAGLIYWPSRAEIQPCLPPCYKRWPNLVCILDCFEIPSERPSHIAANTQVFSSYKNRPTCKFLLACTPAGTVSYISSAAGGNMSDKEIVTKSGILHQFKPGDQCMTDKGFKIEGQLLECGVELIIPPFVCKGKPFTPQQNDKNKQIAHSHIHVERVIGRVRDYEYMNGVIPINQLDLATPAVKLCCELTNLKHSVVRPT